MKEEEEKINHKSRELREETERLESKAMIVKRRETKGAENARQLFDEIAFVNPIFEPGVLESARGRLHRTPGSSCAMGHRCRDAGG